MHGSDDHNCFEVLATNFKQCWCEDDKTMKLRDHSEINTGGCLMGRGQVLLKPRGGAQIRPKPYADIPFFKFLA